MGNGFKPVCYMHLVLILKMSVTQEGMKDIFILKMKAACFPKRRKNFRKALETKRNPEIANFFRVNSLPSQK